MGEKSEGEEKKWPLECVRVLVSLSSSLSLPHTHTPSLPSLLSLTAPAVIAGCSQVKSYYRSEFSIPPHPIKAQLAWERCRRLPRGKKKKGKKKLLWKQPNQHSFNCGMCFCVNVFTPCAVLNAGRGGGKVRGLYFGNRLKGRSTLGRTHGLF